MPGRAAPPKPMMRNDSNMPHPAPPPAPAVQSIPQPKIPPPASATNNDTATSTAPPLSQQQQQQQQQPTTTSTALETRLPQTKPFPHAFERWEMLSSRWEGLTGYWISKLEQNKYELANLPLEQQMSRQITDLSSAGANLFHAVVELQRLRASSERKFQRWFFETRADQERIREMTSELEATLRVERSKRAEAMAKVHEAEAGRRTAEKLVEEMRRELQISREECRRAWEELGRREQEERERTNSLREGHPTLVGGVQVLPMPLPNQMHGSGHGSAQPSVVDMGSQYGHDPGYAGSDLMDQPILGPSTHTTPDPTQMYGRGGQPYYDPRTGMPLQSPQAPHQQQQYHSGSPRHTGSTPPAPGLDQPRNKAGAGAAAVGAGAVGAGAGAAYAEDVSQVTNEMDGLSVVEEAESDVQTNNEHAAWGRYDNYGGQGFAPQPWEPRHHHPTRLSDVVEEDTQTERSG